jgi:sugar lactone lactonase YvrE
MVKLSRLAAAGPSLAALLVLLTGDALAQPLVFTHFAGSTSGGHVDGTGSAARFSSASGIAVDGAGNIYLADGANNAVRKVSPTGAVTTLAGSGSPGSADGTGAFASFASPYGVAVDPAGNVIVADAANNRIRKISPGRVVTTVAGSGSIGRADGAGWIASFSFPLGVAVDGTGTIYVADTDSHLIRKVSPSGVVTTLAGSGEPGYQDGTGAAAAFRYPSAIAIDAAGNLFVSDWANNRIRKVTAAGVVTTFAGSGSYGSANGTGTAASFGFAQGLAFDGAGNLLVADSGNNLIRKVTPAGVVSTVAGSGATGGADGPAASASFYLPLSVAVDAAGNVFVGDQWNATVRKITAGGTVSTLAGVEAVGFADGTGDSARFFSPVGAAVDAAGNVYVADGGNHRIRKISPAGAVTTFAGSGVRGNANGTGTAAQFDYPTGVAVDGPGNVYVADNNNYAIRKITPAGAVTLLAGGTYGDADGAGAGAKLNSPDGIAVDASGNVYFSDQYVYKIKKSTPAGVVTTIAGSGADGNTDGPGAAASFSYPRGLAVDGSGNVFVADSNNYRIRKITPAGAVSTLAGSGFYGDGDGTGKGASFMDPRALAFDRSGNLLVVDAGSGKIRQVTMGGVVTTIAGSGAEGNADGSGTNASFHDPAGIAVAQDGKVYVTDYMSSCVRIGQPGLGDAATVDAATGPVGQPRHLDVTPAGGTAWEWKPIRIPTGSTATLSATAGRSPTFTPDLADGYSFQLGASGGGMASLSYVSLTASPAGAACAPDAETLCLLGDRFKVKAEYADYGGGHGKGKAVALTPDTGYFWFFGASNVEAIAKMVSFCGADSNNVAIYAGGLTDLDVTLHVTDTRSGTTKDYRNPLGNAFTLLRDGPFGCPAGAAGALPGSALQSGSDEASESGAPRASQSGRMAAVPGALPRKPGPSLDAECERDGTTLCLLSYRYQVRATYQDYGGLTGKGHAVSLTGDTGYFWFFDGRNIEAVVKMVSFCGTSPGNVSVYAGGTTDLAVTLEVKDTVTGLTKSYTNPLGTPFRLVRDGPFSCP